MTSHRTTSQEERVRFLRDGGPSSASSSTTAGDYAQEDIEYLAKPYEPASHDRPWATGLVSWCWSRPRNLRRKLRRRSIYLLCPVLKYVCFAILILVVITPIFFPSYTRPPPHYRELASKCEGVTAEQGCANPFGEKVFISVSLYDKGGHLAGGTWGRALLELIHLIGEDNVFLSIYENDSGPEGEAALGELKKGLRCRNSLVYDAHVPLADFPTVHLPDGTDRIKRLAYLSEMRNRALRPIDAFDEQLGAVKYDKIFFLNDVAFHPVDAAQLLFSTNVGADGRTHYLSTCALDYNHPFKFYDLFAQRDAEGYSNGLPIFPIFSGEGKGLSRAAMLAQHDAVPVTSCWGGMVAMQAQYVQNWNSSLPAAHFDGIGRHVIDPANPANVTSPVRFRYEPEVFFDACECCLLLADVAQVARKHGDKDLGTYVNPYVRVAYSYNVLPWLDWVKRWERLFSVPQGILTPLFRLPTHNPHRTVKEGDGFMEEIWVDDGHSGHWELVQRVARNGLFCGVREMQLIQTDERTNDVNWENTRMPSGQTLYFPT